MRKPSAITCRMGERLEEELGEERELNQFDGSEEAWAQQPLPDGAITVGLDGGFVRAAHKQGWFEVIAGKEWWRSDGTKRARCRLPSVSDSCKLTMRSPAGDYGSC